MTRRKSLRSKKGKVSADLAKPTQQANTKPCTPERLTRRSHLSTHMRAPNNRSASLRGQKRTLVMNEMQDVQKCTSKKPRLQFLADHPVSPLQIPLQKAKSGSMILRKRRDDVGVSNRDSQKGVLAQSTAKKKRKNKLKATTVSNPSNKKSFRKPAKASNSNNSATKTKAAIIHKVNAKLTKQVAPKTKKLQKVQLKVLNTVAKRAEEVTIADGNNNEVSPEADKNKSRKKKRDPDEETSNKVITKKKRTRRNRLDPKPFVTEYLQDPTFYSREPIPNISTLANSRLLIRAVLLDDNDLLLGLINDKKSICSLKMCRSLNLRRDAFSYALEKGNVRALELLCCEAKDTIKDLGKCPSITIEEETTGSNSTYMFGHAVRSVSVGRGGREGNNALLKDKSSYLSYYSTDTIKASISNQDFESVLCWGHPLSKLQEITSTIIAERETTLESVKNDCLHLITKIIQAGHNQTAGQLVKAANEKDGFGFNRLHEEVLLNTTEPLTPFKSVSVIKKATYNSRITPLHCACINPNPQYLQQLLNSNPTYDVADERKWLPIHYAVVCTGKGPLELLLTHDVSIYQYTKLGESPLHLAAYHGRHENVDVLLAYESKNKPATASPSHSLLERKTKAGDTPLHTAVRNGHLEVVKSLIRGGANPSKYTPAEHGKLTPLMIAAQYGQLEILKFLIDSEVKIDAVDNRGRSALTHAVTDGQAHIVSYLLRLGANHKITDSSLNTLVHYAAAYGWYFNLKLLLEAGCPLNEESAWKMTPLVIAFAKGHMGIVEFILGHCDVNINSIIDDKNGMTLLLQTCAGSPFGDYVSKIKFLVEEQKADVTIADFEQNTALHYIVLNEAKHLSDKHDNSEVQTSIFNAAKYLIDHGCNPLATNSKNESPIYLSFQRRCFLLLDKFLEWGFPLPEEKDSLGNTFLHTMVNLLDSPNAIYLYKKCAENPIHLQKMKDMANVHNEQGYPPLLYLFSNNGHTTDPKKKAKVFKYFSFLVNTLNADIAAIDSREKSKNSIFHIVVTCSFVQEALEKILPLYFNLEIENYDKLTPLGIAISKGSEETATLLINEGADVNITFPDKDSLVLKIVKNSTFPLKLLQLVIEKGASVFDVDEYTGNTLLHYLASRPDTYLVIRTMKQLINAGIDVNAKNKDGRTALHLVVNTRGGEIDSAYEIEKLLISAGANLATRDKRGRLPLHMVFVKINKHTVTSFLDPIELLALLVGAMKDSVKNYADEIKLGDNFGATPLHYAAYRGATICCSYLIMLMNGVKDIVDNNGNTPFGLAVRNGHEGCSLQFEQSGADFTLMVDSERKSFPVTPEEKAWQWSYIKIQQDEDRKKTIVTERPIIEEVIRKDWQGILYLMLESLNTSGVGSSLAIASAIRTGRLKLTDKLVDQAISSELVAKDGNSLLHTLAREYGGCENTLLESIVTNLVSKGVSPVAKDANGCTPIILAAIRPSDYLCELLVYLTPEEMHSLFNTADKYGRNAITALFWSLDGDNCIPRQLKVWAEKLMKSGVSANSLCVFPIKTQPYATVRYFRCDSQLESMPFNYTPLIFAVIIGNHDTVKWLLTLKVPNNNVDVNGKDYKGRTALMHAVRLNDIKMVKILLNPFAYDPTKDTNPWQEPESSATKEQNAENVSAIPVLIDVNPQVSFDIRDKRGWSVADYLVASFENFQFANAKMIFRLLGSKLMFLQKSGDGISPLERARKMNRANIVELIKATVGVNVEEDKTDYFEYLYKSNGSCTEVDFVNDCQEMTKIMIETEKKDNTDSDKVSADPVLQESDRGKECTVVVDEKDNTPFNCSLIYVDMTYGSYGLYNFYKMQVVEQVRGPIKLILLFTRWGRVGDTGQFQKTPFPNTDEAIKEFKKVFKAKTGNAWENLNSFTPIDKKYRLLNESDAKQSSPVKIDFDLLRKTEHHPQHDSTLSDGTIKLMKVLCFAHSNVGYQSGFPRGSLAYETYKEAEEILEEISEIIKSGGAVPLKQRMFGRFKRKYENTPEGEEKTKAIEMLSEEYYSLIPVDNFSSDRIKPITSENDIRDKQKWIHSLIHLNVASQIILAAQYNLTHRNGNPFEYIYRSLNTQLQVLDSKGEDAQIILEYINNSEGNINIKNIYSVQRFGEPERFKANGVGNPWILWHGTSNTNLLSILQRGLHVAPLESNLNGDLFGRGIYFADRFSKSAGYCRSDNKKYVFLCEVALGNIHPVNFSWNEGLQKSKSPPADFNSLQTSNSRCVPDPSSTIIWNGCIVPLGRSIANPNFKDQYSGLNFNEFIVFDEKQVILRYLIEFT